jgi:hypothetical protein
MAGAGSATGLSAYPADTGASKVPLPTASFWAITVLIAGASWAWPDELIGRFGEAWFGVAVGLTLAATLSAQVSRRGYSRWRYCWPCCW